MDKSRQQAAYLAVYPALSEVRDDADSLWDALWECLSLQETTKELEEEVLTCPPLDRFRPEIDKLAWSLDDDDRISLLNPEHFKPLREGLRLIDGACTRDDCQALRQAAEQIREGFHAVDKYMEMLEMSAFGYFGRVLFLAHVDDCAEYDIPVLNDLFIPEGSLFADEGGWAHECMGLTEHKALTLAKEMKLLLIDDSQPSGAASPDGTQRGGACPL